MARKATNIPELQAIIDKVIAKWGGDPDEEFAELQMVPAQWIRESKEVLTNEDIRTIIKYINRGSVMTHPKGPRG